MSTKATNMGFSKLNLLRIGIALIYLWFGALKFFGEMSPASKLATTTMTKLSFHMVDEKWSLLLLGIVETLLGTFLLTNVRLRWVIRIASLHLAGTFSPLLLLPDTCFVKVPFGLTLEGQYIIKNIVLLLGFWIIFPSKEAHAHSDSVS